MDYMVANAMLFAMRAHESIDQRRKFTGEPYINHPMEVARILEYAADSVTPEMYAAAYLHDVVEDTPVTLEEIREAFGPIVAQLVDDLTDVSRPEDGNRAARKAKDLAHTAGICPEAQTVKLADIISNTRDIITHAPDFAKVYLPEKKAQLEVLTMGDKVLHAYASRLVEKGLKRLQLH